MKSFRNNCPVPRIRHGPANCRSRPCQKAQEVPAWRPRIRTKAQKAASSGSRCHRPCRLVTQQAMQPAPRSLLRIPHIRSQKGAWRLFYLIDLIVGCTHPAPFGTFLPPTEYNGAFVRGSPAGRGKRHHRSGCGRPRAFSP